MSLIAGPIEEPRNPRLGRAAVEEHGAAVRMLYQGRIALADVE